MDGEILNGETGFYSTQRLTVHRITPLSHREHGFLDTRKSRFWTKIKISYFHIFVWQVKIYILKLIFFVDLFSFYGFSNSTSRHVKSREGASTAFFSPGGVSPPPPPPNIVTSRQFICLLRIRATYMLLDT